MIDSPLFGAVFRQNAYRALLLPSPGHFRRTPFWLQRLRSKDLLAIAKSFTDFPIVLETYRDALEDFMDMPGLERILDDVQSGKIEVRYVESDVPSPVARALDHGFESIWMYSWDTPKAERGLQALNIDRDLLAQLFRNPEAAGLLRSEAIEEVSSVANRSASGMKARTETELAQLFAEIGDLTEEEVSERCEDEWPSWLRSLAAQNRLVSIRFEVEGRVEHRWVDATLEHEYRGAIADSCDYGAVRRVVARFLARSGPVSISVLQSRYPIELSALRDALDEMMADSSATSGYFTESGVEEWLDLAMLARIQERTLSILRSEVRPSDPLQYQAALLKLHGFSDSSHESHADATDAAIERLMGVPIAAEQWTNSVLPARVEGFRSAHLNELMESGELQWVFCAGESQESRNIAFVPSGKARFYLPAPTLKAIGGGSDGLVDEAQRVYTFIAGEGIVDSETILLGTQEMTPSRLAAVMRDLALRGLVTCNSWPAATAISNSSPVRDTASRDIGGPASRQHRYGSRLHRIRRSARRQFSHQFRETQRILVPGATWSVTSRFSFLGPEVTDDVLAERRASALLERHGVVTKRAIELDRLGWEWRPIYAALNLMELRGSVRRGYFVDGLPGVQFAKAEFVDLLRSEKSARDTRTARVISALDPAFVFDRNLVSVSNGVGADMLGVTRIASNKIAFVDDRPLLIATLEGAHIQATDAFGREIEEALQALVESISQGSATKKVVVQTWNGTPAIDSPATDLLERIGFRRDYPNMVYDALSAATARR